MSPVGLLAQIALREIILSGLRLVVAVGVAFVAWVLCGPLVRLIARLFTKKPLPNWAVFLFRSMGAVVAGLLVFYYLPLGFGGSGWGFGPGPGGTPGAGGNGLIAKGKPGKSQATQNGEDSDGKDGKPSAAKETLAIEMLGGKRFLEGSGKYYLIQRKAPAITLDEVEAYLKKNQDRFHNLQIVLTGESVAERHTAVTRLRHLADNKYKIPSVIVDLSAK
jgi:hypothetical protein